MSHEQSVRILMYSHDTFGLGHLTRTLRIARAIRSIYANTSVLILSGSPVAPYFALPSATDLVKLPAVMKVGKDRYRSRELDLPFPRIKRLRWQLIRATAEVYRPHVFMVDNVPRGMKGEVLPTLRYLRSARPSTRIVLNLRDILDDAETIHETWDRENVPAILEEYYDQIFILGDPRIYDAREAYRLPPSKTTYVGYATPGDRIPADPPEGAPDRPRVLLTAGGGGDGFEFLRQALQALVRPCDRSHSGIPRDAVIDVVTGPLMSPENRRTLRELTQRPNMRLFEFIPDLPSHMQRADLVVAMAGYNTCCEILSHARDALLFPRIHPRTEQLIRAQSFEAQGIAGLLHPEKMDPETVLSCIGRRLSLSKLIDPQDLPRLVGQRNLAEELVKVVPGLKAAAAPRSKGCPAGGAELPQAGSGFWAEETHHAPYWYWPGATATSPPAS